MLKQLAIFALFMVLAGCAFKSPNRLAEKSDHFKNRVDALKKLLPDSTLKNVPNDYWFYNGEGQVVRLPLVWPFSIYSVDGLGNARLYDDRNVTDYKTAISKKQPKMQDLEYLKEFNFDGHLLLAHTSTNGGFLNNNKNPLERWIIFVFDTKQVLDAENEMSLFAKAKEMGYNGKETLFNIEDYGLSFN